MKILIIGNFSFEKEGGASVVANYLIREYKKSGYEVDILSFFAETKKKEEKDFWGDKVGIFKVFSGKLSRVFSQFLDIYNPHSIYLLKREIQRIKPDIIHLHNIHKDISAYSVKLIHRLNIPVIITLHDFWALCPGFNLENNEMGEIRCRKPLSRFQLPFFLRNFFIKRFISCANYIIVPSDFARLKLLDYGYSGDKVKRIYNGVDLDMFFPLTDKNAFKETPVKIIFVGRITRKKGAEFLKKACEELQQEGFEIVLEMIGNDKSVPYAGLSEHYRQADICVQPSLVHETFGLTIIEAMACSLPIIVTDMGAMPEIVGDAGIIIKSGDIADLKSALKDLILNSEKRAHLGVKGCQRVKYFFDWNNNAQEYLNYLEKIKLKINL